MKRINISIFLLAAMITAQAQTEATIGVKAGANFSTWVGLPMEDVQLRNSFYAGIFANLPLNKYLSLQPEAIYSDDGTKAPDTKIMISYIKVPLLLRYQHNTGFHIEAGPQLGWRMRAKNKTKNDPELDITNAINPIETSFAVGAGFQWSRNWDITLRYNGGLSVVGEGDDKIRSSVIAIGLAYTFRHK